MVAQRDTLGHPGSFRQFVRDREGRLIAFYDKRTNLTRDREGRLIGYGDLTMFALNKKK